MQKQRIEPPQQEPITLEEVKSHLRIINDEEDDYIKSLITTARQDCEKFQNRAYYTQKWKLALDKLQNGIITIPRPPCQSIDRIVLVNNEGTEHEVTDYETDLISEPARLKIEDYPSVNLQEMSGLQIEYTAGYETVDDIPDNVKHAIKLLIGEWYAMRENAIATGAVPQEIPDGVKRLLSKDRVMPV